MARTSEPAGSSPEEGATGDGNSSQLTLDDLPPDGQFIRIMSLKPSEHEATLFCETKTTPLKDARGKYEALSYTWGNPVPPKEISRNGLTIPLRPNLASALRRLRDPSSTRDLWVDYICINQESTPERDRQVKIMHEVYNGAKEVIAWIGEETKTSDVVMDYIAKMDSQTAIREFNDWRKTNRVENPRPHVLERDDTEWTNNVDHFMSRPWFRRVWIQQEAVMCSKTTILCGTKTVTWDQMFAFAWMLSLGGALTPIVDRHWKFMSEDSKSAIKLIRTIQNMRNRHVKKARKPTLLFVLHSARLAQANPNFKSDKIYAVQHLASLGKGDEMMLEPDYKAKWQTVYEELAIKYLKKRGSDILSYAGRAIQYDHKLPSWVPDWNYEKSYRLTQRKWKAGGIERQVATVDQKVLFICGAIIGKIKNLSSTISGYESQETEAKAEEIAYAMIDKDCIYSGEETQLQAYSRTLVADNPQDYSIQETTSLQFQQKFDQWRLWLRNEASEALRARPKYDIAIENTGTFVHRQFGFIDSGLMCLVPVPSIVGDQICLIQGLDRPMVVREKGKYREFIGECYVHGAMEGQRCPALYQKMEFV